MVSLYTLQQTAARLLPATENPPLLSIGMVCSLALAAFCAICTIFSVIARMLQPKIDAGCGSWLSKLSCLICIPTSPQKVSPVSEMLKQESESSFWNVAANSATCNSELANTSVDDTNRVSNVEKRLAEQSDILKDMMSHLAILSRSTCDVVDKKVRDKEQTRRWRIMDSVTNISLFIAYLAVALTCLLLFDTSLSL